MQPNALTLEPVIILSAFVFLFGIVPLAMLITAKCRTKVRVLLIGAGLVCLVFGSFKLGTMTGLSMAWNHWDSEYKTPLWNWQITMNDFLAAGDTNGLVRIVERFGEENIQSYGREKIFTQGKFRDFVDGLPEPSRSTAKK